MHKYSYTFKLAYAYIPYPLCYHALYVTLPFMLPYPLCYHALYVIVHTPFTNDPVRPNRRRTPYTGAISIFLRQLDNLISKVQLENVDIPYLIDFFCQQISMK